MKIKRNCFLELVLVLHGFPLRWLRIIRIFTCDRGTFDNITLMRARDGMSHSSGQILFKLKPQSKLIEALKGVFDGGITIIVWDVMVDRIVLLNSSVVKYD